MAVDGWKQEQDNARTQWKRERDQQSSQTEATEIARCNAAHAQRIANCDSIQCTGFTNCDAIQCTNFTNCDSIQCTSFADCDAIQCTSYTNCDSYSKFDPRRYACYTARGICVTAKAVERTACWTARGVCVAAKAVERAACWTARGICVAAKAVERAACWTARAACVAAAATARAVCIAGSAIELAACVAAAWVKNTASKTLTWLGDKAWAVGTAVVWGVRKIWDAVTGKAAPDGKKPSPNLADLPPFPADFLWGVATSAYQVEGNITQNDWDVFTNSPAIVDRVAALSSKVGRPYNLKPADVAVHHGNLDVLKEDLDRAKLLGMNAYRFSFEWGRIQPSFGKVDNAALQYYHDAIEEMHKRGLKPVATLNHLSLPKWVLTPPRESSITSAIGFPIAVEDDPFRQSLRGWENEATIEAFLAFVQMVVGTYMNRVDTWITVNEPVGSMVGLGYIAGIWPPGFNLDGERAKKAYFNIMKAHVKAYRLIKSIYGDRPSSVGIVHAMLYPKLSGAVTAAGTGASVGAVVGGIVGAIGGFVVGGLPGAFGGAVLGAALGAGVGAGVGAISNEHEAAKNQFDYYYNYHILDSLTTGQVDVAIHRREANRDYRNARDFFGIPSTEEWKPQLDFIGVNYYRSVYVYYDQILATGVPGVVTGAGFSGGAFRNDLYGSNEKHNLLNDLGWEICPEGLYRILTEGLNDRYHLPIIITENGIAESSDRNRASYVVAHLQQLRAAMRDGADVRGYICWSLLDNWELQENYHQPSRFGLFTVDRDVDLASTNAKTFPRHITEGALAFQYVIANNEHISHNNSHNNPFTETVLRFGAISSDGSETQPMTKLAGGAWEGYFSGNEPAFTLYLSRLALDGWLGMLFLQDSRRWVRLEDVSWQHGGDGRGTLRFWHWTNEPDGPRTVYEATTGRVGELVEGSRTAGLEPSREKWRAERIRRCGVWKSINSGGAPSLIAINRLEGDYERWHAKYIYGNRQWIPGETSVNWNGFDVKVEVTGFTDTKTIEGTLDGNTLRATIALLGGAGTATVQWEGTILPDDSPF